MVVAHSCSLVYHASKLRKVEKTYFLKIFKTDKVHFTSLNLVYVYTHPKFQNMKFTLSLFDKIFKTQTQNFFYARIEHHIRAFD